MARLAHATFHPAALPIQLASKLTPEMEARDAELAAGVETPAAAAAGPATAASVRFSEISAQLDDFNRFVSGITGSGGLLAYRVRGGRKAGTAEDSNISVVLRSC